MKSPVNFSARRLGLILCLAGLIPQDGMMAQLQPEFTGIQRLTNRETLLSLRGATGVSYRIDAATNLPDWSGLLTLFSTGVNRHTDAATPFLSRRFYRAEQLSGTNHLTGDHLVTTNGDVVLHPIVHASFLMSWNGKAIYNDPDTANYSNFPPADLILIGHHHSDHLDIPTLNFLRKSNTVIIASMAVYTNSIMTALLRSHTTVLTNGATTNVIGLTVEAVPAYNVSNSNHPRGRDNGYVLTIGGKRIYMAGDTEDVPEMRALREIDVAFLPMNRPFTMFVTNAASATREFRPRVVYPYHYIPSTPPADLNEFKRLVGTDLGIEVRLRNWYP